MVLSHIQRVRERERESDKQIPLTLASVSYHATLRNGTVTVIESPASFPDSTDLKECREPIVMATLIFPNEYIGTYVASCWTNV